MSPGSIKNVTYILFVYKSYISNIYLYKQDLVLNNQQGSTCHKKHDQPINQIRCIIRRAIIVLIRLKFVPL